MIKRFFFLTFLFLLASCYKGHLYVQQEWVGTDNLASTHVNTPDPRQKHPDIGQQIIICWDYPLSTFRKELSMKVYVRFWDQSQQEITHTMDRKRGYAVFFFENPKREQDKKILTYRIEVYAQGKDLIEEWNHQFWTNPINLD